AQLGLAGADLLAAEAEHLRRIALRLAVDEAHLQQAPVGGGEGLEEALHHRADLGPSHVLLGALAALVDDLDGPAGGLAPCPIRTTDLGELHLARPKAP